MMHAVPAVDPSQERVQFTRRMQSTLQAFPTHSSAHVNDDSWTGNQETRVVASIAIAVAKAVAAAFAIATSIPEAIASYSYSISLAQLTL